MNLAMNPNTKTPNAKIEALCRYIDEHADEPLTLAALGERAGMSSFHLQRSFKAHHALTPGRYAQPQAH